MTIPTAGELLNALITGVLLGGVFAITALGLSLVFGVMRLVNIVHGELIVLGAYLALYLTRHAGIDPLLSMLIVAPLLFLFALPLIGQNLFILIWSGDTQSLQASYATASLSLGSVRIPAMYLISFAIALLLCGGVHLMLQRTGLGREIRASSEDSATAAGLGVNVTRVRLFVYGIAAACAAVGGVLVGLTFDFTPTTGLTYLLTGFAVVVLGGLGSVKGTLLGAILLGVIESVGASFFGDGYRDLIGFVAFLIVLSLRPQGLFGRVQLS